MTRLPAGTRPRRVPASGKTTSKYCQAFSSHIETSVQVLKKNNFEISEQDENTVTMKLELKKQGC
jgi:hypothetical protein